jgi:hypothetical protein
VTAVSRRVVKLTGLPRNSLQMIVDTEYFLRCSLRAEKVRAMSRPLAAYRVHSGSATARTSRNGVFVQERRQITSLIVRDLTTNLTPSVQNNPQVLKGVRALRQASARSIFEDGVGAMTNGARDDGVVLMRSAFDMDPRIIWDLKVAVNLVLVVSGPIGRRLFRFLHRHRIDPAQANT